ncbi:hypothetical protein PoB_004011100 [Plakobranchus ocellatus]|uniref:C2H2-type domain-containing protein n=1 Tax=Plakobranchus ocellatus TaxID=259542 RepID=A0AAV4B461_9GAST|nr:hypothetical protein PoB_004011100 [Plakobranchus ocellatus]
MKQHSGTTRSRLWFPGRGCPVFGCGARIFRKSYDLKRHWWEKHERIVAAYPCSICSHISKRRFDVIQHFTANHGSVQGNDRGQCVGEVKYQENQRFVDPHPLTLEAVLGKDEFPCEANML